MRRVQICQYGSVSRRFQAAIRVERSTGFDSRSDLIELCTALPYPD